jgi:predicted TIM-barrel fold metal-dependent hydrolase
MQSARLIWAEDEPRDIGRDMRSGGITGLHPTREGHLYISANTPHFWRALCVKIGLPELAQDERYDSVRKRAQHQSHILPLLHKALAVRSALEWEAIFGEEVPCAAARSVEDMFDNPQVLAQGLMTDYEHPVVGRYRGFTAPVEFSRTPGPTPFAAPTLGQHSNLIRAEAQRHANIIKPGGCDSHIHIYDARFAPLAGRQLLSGTTVQDYQRDIQHVLGTQRTVIVTPTVYGTDNRATLDAIAQLGIAHARGVAVLHPNVSDEELHTLHAGGIRGIRFTLFDPATSVTSFDMIEPLAERVHALGWHVQLHLRAEQIVSHAALIERLPCVLVFDHMARLPTPDGGLNQAAFDIVKQRLDRRNTWVKLSGAYLDARGPHYEGSFTAAQALVQAAPDRMVWGSDWPHPTEKQQRPDDVALFALLSHWVPDAAVRQQILVDNPNALYGFDAL